DVDGDGDNDAVTESWKKHQLIRLLNNGSGTFVSKKTFLAALQKQNLLGDLDGDGDLDVLLDGFDESIYLNGGPGNCSVASVPIFPGPGGEPAALRDFDGDGRVDLLLAAYQFLWVLPGDGVGGFQPTGPASPWPSGGVIGVGDLDGDGDFDLV